ncbi:MAG TPA: hypothetical protein VGB20_01535 [bacterium]
MSLTGQTWAEGEHEHAHGEAVSQEETLTGEVVDVFCYLSHGKQGLGSGHAACAKKCIGGGLPVAIRSGGALYLATMASHEPANQALEKYAGQEVTVRGKVMEQDGQRVIAITDVQPAS